MTKVAVAVSFTLVLLFAPGTAVPAWLDGDEVRTLDGKGNNLRNPTWGQQGTQYLRFTTRYADGVARMVEGVNERFVSNRVFNDTHQNIFSEGGVTQWGFVWGQFMDHVFGLRQDAPLGPGDVAPIAFADSSQDRLEEFTNDFGVIPFDRSPAAPGTGVNGRVRQVINTVSSYIDAWNVYGGVNQQTGRPERLEWLREGPFDGTMANNRATLLMSRDGLLPRARNTSGGRTTGNAPAMAREGRLLGTPNEAFIAGDVRANENLGLTATHTLFALEHNRIVRRLPFWLPEEQKFQIARRVVIAEQQRITYEEFLPALGVTLSSYRGYNPFANASLSNEFAVVGFRAHSMIHGEFETEVEAAEFTAEQLAELEALGVEVEVVGDEIELAIPLNVAFFQPQLLAKIGLANMLRAPGLEPQYQNDEQIDNQLRSVLFQVPVAGNEGCLDGPELPNCFRGVVDLGAIDVKRGKDHGIQDYNDLRREYGLEPKFSFRAITGERSEDLPLFDSQINRFNPLNDVDILDFTKLTLRDGTVVRPVSTGGANPAPVDDDVVEAERRTTLAWRLKAIYGDVNRVDAFVGMVSEPHLFGKEMGELQYAIWKRQFEALRDGDRFFYAGTPEQAQLASIKRRFGIDYAMSLGQIINLNTGAGVADDVFHVSG